MIKWLIKMFFCALKKKSNLNYKNAYVVCRKTKHNIVTQSNGNL